LAWFCEVELFNSEQFEKISEAHDALPYSDASGQADDFHDFVGFTPFIPENCKASTAETPSLIYDALPYSDVSGAARRRSARRPHHPNSELTNKMRCRRRRRWCGSRRRSARRAYLLSTIKSVNNTYISINRRR